ncbi:hypothetical protein TUM17387_39080 [Shewanella carassii]|nr:hypothetical protein TUM17387_39080 [Shewanella carassii]
MGDLIHAKFDQIKIKYYPQTYLFKTHSVGKLDLDCEYFMLYSG